MKIVCRECGYEFARLPGSDPENPPEREPCPRCGAVVDVRAQIAELAARTTDAGGAHRSQADPVGPGISHRSLGDYEILDEVSRGAMGVIYKARHRKLGRVVALKVMIAGEHASADQVKRFEKEARAAARLRHPNIVPIYDIGIEGGHSYFTMDFIEGTPLDVLVARKGLTPRRSLEIAAELADALAYAHARGVIHRDIKPSNIIVDTAGRPQITDFGLAKQMDSDTKFTRTGTTIGTPSYMAPEQARGENERVDQRSDVYSLGAVLYEMLAGRPPFTGETMMNIVMKVIHDEPVSLRKLSPRIHRDIQTIVFKAMEKEPARRYPSMMGFADDIRRYMAGEMIAARPVGPLRRAGRALKKRRETILTGLAVALLVSAVSGAIIRLLVEQWNAARRQAEDAERRRESAVAELAEQKPEWVVQYQDDFSKPALGAEWQPTGKEWAVAGGQLAVDAQKAPRSTTVVLNREFEGKLAFEFTASASSADARINCFLSGGPRNVYVFRFGNWEGQNITLLQAGKVLAQVECPPIKPNVTYRFRLERRNAALHYRVTGGGETNELRYDDPVLLATLGRVRFGLDTWGCGVSFDDVRVSREEFPGERFNKLQAIDFLYLSRGLLDKALAEYRSIISKQHGEAFAVLAEHNCGLIEEALLTGVQKDPKLALQHYEEFERGNGVLPEKDAAVVAKNRERLFFVLIEMGQYKQAAEDLAAACDRGQTFDAGSAWQFPAILSRCAGELAYEPALTIMEKARFDGGHATLRDQWQAAGSKVRSNFLRAVNEVCTGFAEQKKPEELKRAFAALPDPRATKGFEVAVAKALDAGEDAGALDLLLFLKRYGMKSDAIELSVLALGQRQVTAKQQAKLVDLHTTYPTRKLAPLFARAVSDLAAADEVDGAMRLLEAGCERFPEDKRTFADLAANAVFQACQKAGRYADVRRAYGLLGDPRFARRLTEAVEEQLRANRLDGALEMLEYVRTNVPERVREVGPLVGELAAKFVAADRAEAVADLAANYPGARLAEPLAAALDAACKSGRRSLIEKLMVVALARFAADPPVAAGTATAAKMLLEAGEPDVVLRIYVAAAKAIGEDKDAAAAVLVGGGKVLLAGRAYAQAAAAYTAAAEAGPKNADLAAWALVRAAVIHHHRGDAESAMRTWREIPEKYAKANGAVNVAKLMSGALRADEFRQWFAQNPRGFEPGEDSFYLALAAGPGEDKKGVRELLKKALAVGRTAWFADIAQSALDKIPETP